MNPRRWKQVEEVLQSVLDRPREEREAFLRDACEGDTELEREVRSLLASEWQAERFLEHPAIEVAARAVARRESNVAREDCGFPAGSTVSHYRIARKLGGG